MAPEDPQPDPQHDEAAGPSAETDFSDPQKLVDQALAEAQSSIDDLRDATAGDGAGEVDDDPGGDGGTASAMAGTGLDLLGDVDLDVTVELGRTQMLVEDVLRLSEGSVVELDKLAGDPVDVYVNGRLIARGEVLVLNDNFCIRISEIVADLGEQAEQVAQQVRSQAG